MNDFDNFLQSQPGFEHYYPYLWKDISDFANAFLKNNENQESTQSLLNTLTELEPLVKELKLN